MEASTQITARSERRRGVFLPGAGARFKVMFCIQLNFQALFLWRPSVQCERQRLHAFEPLFPEPKMGAWIRRFNRFQCSLNAAPSRDDGATL